MNEVLQCCTCYFVLVDIHVLSDEDLGNSKISRLSIGLLAFALLLEVNSLVFLPQFNVNTVLTPFRGFRREYKYRKNTGFIIGRCQPSGSNMHKHDLFSTEPPDPKSGLSLRTEFASNMALPTDCHLASHRRWTPSLNQIRRSLLHCPQPR